MEELHLIFSETLYSMMKSFFVGFIHMFRNFGLGYLFALEGQIPIDFSTKTPKNTYLSPLVVFGATMILSSPQARSCKICITLARPSSTNYLNFIFAQDCQVLSFHVNDHLTVMCSKKHGYLQGCVIHVG